MAVHPTLTATAVHLKGGQNKVSTSQSTSSVKVLPTRRQGAVTALLRLEKALPGPILYNHRV